MVQFFWSKKKM